MAGLFAADGASLAVAAALVLSAAKTHGRQVRLRREAEGPLQVDFRRDNHPWVEALWRRDRIGFWLTFLALGAAAVALGLHGHAGHPEGWTGWLAHGAVAFAGSFVAMAIWWWIDLARSGLPAPRRAHGGTASWLALDALLAGALAWLIS